MCKTPRSHASLLCHPRHLGTARHSTPPDSLASSQVGRLTTPPPLPPPPCCRVAVKEELATLTRLAGVDLRPEVFEVLVELTRLNVVPTATAQARARAMCIYP